MAYQRVDLDKFSEVFSSTTELSSVAIGGEIVAVSDEFFAEAFHLLLPAPSLKGQFGPKGALYSGWETRRHNPTYDWAIIKLGTTGTISGFDIDTSHFNGNEAPQVSVEGLCSPAGEAPPKAEDPRWSEILPKTALGPSSRHLFTIPDTGGINYVKLNMYPDGGIARFRVYGHVIPIHPASEDEYFDLAHVFAGGRVVYISDQHFGVGSNLILPGRGKDMGDGWETKRSRQPAHKDWVIIKLGTPGSLSHVVIDTAHFKGNFPQSCDVHAISSTSDIPPHSPSHIPPPSSSPASEVNAASSAQDEWTPVLPRTVLGPHREHFLQLENVEGKTFTHVRVTIFPDGGIKRIRVIGSKISGYKKPVSIPVYQVEDAVALAPFSATTGPKGRIIPALPLTPEAFSPFGQVIQSYPDLHSVPNPRTTKITLANFGTATKYHKLAPVVSNYPAELGATPGISVYRSRPVERDIDGDVEVEALERHPFTNQAFLPMGSDETKRYLVVVAKNGEDDRPDLQSLRAFLVHAGQGIVYNSAVWHQPITVLDEIMDLACVETQVGNGDKADCELVNLEVEKKRTSFKPSMFKSSMLAVTHDAVNILLAFPDGCDVVILNH